jgi:hypothetical protein
MHFQLTKFLVLSSSSQQLHSDRETPLGRRAQEKPLPRNLFGYFFREKSKNVSSNYPVTPRCPIETQLGGGCTAVGILFKVYQPLVGLALGKERKAKPANFGRVLLFAK